MDLIHKITFEPGHDCIRFKCKWGHAACRPEEGGSHGIHGLEIRFLVVGEEGAVQFLLYTGWPPEPKTGPQHSGRVPADLGYHARTPQYEGQSSMGPCGFLEGDECYYDGTSLGADEPFRILCNDGDEALWAFLEAEYRARFRKGEHPESQPYSLSCRA